MDAQTRRAIAALADELQRTQAEVRTLRRGGRTPQLGHSSIERGSFEVRDPETGAVRMRIGYQPDGSVGAIPAGGDPPPAPSAPVVEAMASGLRVTWDGQLAEQDVPLPSDFDHVNVHVSLASGFTPGPADFAATIPRAGGLLPIAPLSPGVTYYVRLVGVGTGGVRGEPSAQASGTPTAVTDIEPGSITEVEIADDAISAPKIRAEAIQAIHIAAEQIQAGHIQAAAVTASKLAADLVLSTRIIAGNPGGARVELDGGGLRGYNSDDELVFIIDDAGDVVFSGVVTGAEIIGSRMTIGDIATTYGRIEQAGDAVHSMVQAEAGPRAQLRAMPTRAEVASYANAAVQHAPVAGFTAQIGNAGWTASSDQTDPSAPIASGVATADSAYMLVRAERDTPSSSRLSLLAQDGLAILEIAGPPPASGPAEISGALYGFRSNSDIHSVSLQSPVADGTVTGGARRSLIHVEGAGAARQHAQVTHFAKTHLFQGESLNGAISTEDGTVTVAATHSILSARHAPVKGEMLSHPSPLQTSTTVWYDFPSGDFAPIAFRTSWSGRTRITIMMAGLNAASPASSIALGFRLSGGSTIPASLRRCAFVRSIGEGVGSSRQSSATVHLQLAGAADYTLTPVYRVTSGAVAYFDLALDNSITVEPLT